MVKKKVVIKKELRSTIKNNIKRYISLIIMIFLGTAFFVGMRINSKVLQNTMIKYYEKYNYSDIQVGTPAGLSDEDLEKIKNKVPNIEKVEGKYYKEIISNINNMGKKTDRVFAVHSYSKDYKLNKVSLQEGRYIEKSNECLVDKDLKKKGYQLGDKITLNDDILTNKEYKIVGFINSPLYISINKGTSDLLSGSINYFIYIDESNFQVEDDLYIAADIKLKDKYKVFSNKYNNYLEKNKKIIANKSKNISERRKKEIIAKKSKELKEAEKKYNIKKREVEKELSEAENRIKSAEQEINYAENKIMSDREIDAYLSALKTNLDASKAQLDSLKSTIDSTNKALNDAYAQGTTNTSVLRNKLQSLKEKIDATNASINKLRSFLEEYEQTCQKVLEPHLIIACNSTLDGIRQKIAEQEPLVNTLQQALVKLSALIETIEEFSVDKTKIAEQMAEYQKYKEYVQGLERKYNEGLNRYNKALQQYNYAVANLKPQNSQARAILNNKKVELEKAKKEFEKKKKEAYTNLEKNYNIIKENKKALHNLTGLDWQVFTRNDNIGYSNYYNDTQKINNLSKLFPLLFYIVASLVTATSITRLIQEERSKIGILRSLGYTKSQITKKYINYSFTASIIGSVLGIATGVFLFPIVFVKIYSLLYYIPKIQYGLYIKEILLAYILSFISTVVIAYFASKNIVNEKPSELMRPKMVNNSKVTLLEKNKSLWKKLGYIKRVTYRNIFLSVGRSVMAIIGIAGCTTLIIAGFGVRDSIQDIINLQYNKISNISEEFFYKQNLAQYEMKEDEEYVSRLSFVENASLNRMEMSEIKTGNKSLSVYTIIPNNNMNLDKEIRLYNIKTQRKVNLTKTDGIVITEKLSKILKIKPGDIMTYKDGSNITHKAKVSAIVENYISNYIYMNKDTYKKTYGYESNNNMLIVKYKDNTSETKANKIIFNNKKHSGFLSMVYYKNMTKIVLQTFDIAIYIIMISAGLLAFVVLYNLAKINISERITEVATLKVLGYDAKKINKYINYEINTLTYIGILLGIIGGYFITDIIITTCELDFIMFYHGISYISYIMGIVLTIVFSKVINLLVSKDLKQISITESLKSID